MTAPVTIPAIAAERIRYGAPARVVKGRAFNEPDVARMSGIVRRTGLHRDVCDVGDALSITTDGHLIAELQPGRPVWTEIRHGKPVPRSEPGHA